MKTLLRIPLVLAVVVALPVGAARAQDARPVATPTTFSTEQLDNLLAPIALYPDPILAQVLVAATFPEQVDIAAKYVRANGTRGIDDQAWDVSVKSVAHYPPVLNMLADRDDWTTALGQAYANQSGDVMESVQHLRHMAEEQGNLASTPQQTVTEDRGQIEIVPAQPRVIYVPTYDPEVVFYRPIYAYAGYPAAYWSFGVGFPIGAWLNYDCDWFGGAVFYDGWTGGGWRARSRPFISLGFTYVQPRYRTVVINRGVTYRHVDYGNFARYNTVHRTVSWANHARPGDFGGRRDQQSVGGGDHRGTANANRDQAYQNRGRDDSRPEYGGRQQNTGHQDNTGRQQNTGRQDNTGRQPERVDPRRGSVAIPPGAPSRVTLERRPDVRPPQQPERRAVSRPPVSASRSAPAHVEQRSHSSGGSSSRSGGGGGDRGKSSNSKGSSSSSRKG